MIWRYNCAMILTFRKQKIIILKHFPCDESIIGLYSVFNRFIITLIRCIETKTLILWGILRFNSYLVTLSA